MKGRLILSTLVAVLFLTTVSTSMAGYNRMVERHRRFTHRRVELARRISHAVTPPWQMGRHYRIEMDANNAHRRAEARAFNNRRAAQAYGMMYQRRRGYQYPRGQRNVIRPAGRYIHRPTRRQVYRNR